MSVKVTIEAAGRIVVAETSGNAAIATVLTEALATWERTAPAAPRPVIEAGMGFAAAAELAEDRA